jgi:hypothetical protein
MRLDYSPPLPQRGDVTRLPLLTLDLTNGQRIRQVTGLVDSGAMVSVLPFQIGIDLGAEWNPNATDISLGGRFRGVPAMALTLAGRVGPYPAVNLYFAWIQSNDVPLILGEYNFFQEFDVHFYRSQFEFEINPKAQ